MDDLYEDLDQAFEWDRTKAALTIDYGSYPQVAAGPLKSPVETAHLGRPAIALSSR